MRSLRFFQLIIIVFFTILIQAGCKKLVEVDPPITTMSSSNVYTSNATAAAVLTGLYTQMSEASLSLSGEGISAMSFLPELSSDNLALLTNLANASWISYYTNDLTNANGDFWDIIYPNVFIVNSALEGISNSSGLTLAVQQQLLGEAKFMRAFYYFYLVNLYGDVPLVTGTNYTVNAIMPRTPQAQVWQQIIQDLKDAQGLLSPEYLDATLLNITSARVRPTSWAATALLARAYLYTGKWDSAEAQANTIINNTSLYGLSSLSTTFLANSTEAIWQLQPVNAGQNTEDALTYIIPPTGPNNTYAYFLSSNLLSSFEAGDQRRAVWVDSVIANGVTYYYPFKYKVDSIGAPVTEYSMVLRLGEVYLIRAEARAQQGETSGAQNDLNAIRSRADLQPDTISSEAGLLAAIMHERQVELFTEWGHRWLDLKRTGMVDSVMGAPGNACQSKGGTWSHNWQWYPVPLGDLRTDPQLVQNAGY